MTIPQTIRDRWDCLLSSSRQDLTDGCREMLKAVLTACDSPAKQTLQARWHQGGLWILCGYTELARLLGWSDRTVWNELNRLQQADALRQLWHPTKRNVIGYRIDLKALEALPQSVSMAAEELPDWFGQEPDNDFQ